MTSPVEHQLKKRDSINAIKCNVARAVAQRVKDRADVGMKTYGMIIDENDKSLVQWVREAQDELLDAVVYLEKVAQTLEKLNVKW